jgi:uncharacterized protein (TIGR02594 family)
MTAWLKLAQDEMGVEEIDGSEDNPRIMEYFSTSGGTWVKNDETPWCGAFVGYAMATSGHSLPKEPLRARAWLAWGTPIEQPVLGCVVILKRGNNPQQGHVGFFMQATKDGKGVLVLGGNQGNRVSIQRFKADDVLGYRMPVGASAPKPEGSRIVSEADAVKAAGVASAGGAVATGVVAPPVVPSPPSLPQVGEWHGFAANIKSFGLFCIESWPWVAAAIGVYLVLSGQAIKWFRKQDTATGKTWEL